MTKTDLTGLNMIQINKVFTDIDMTDIDLDKTDFCNKKNDKD